MLDALGASGVEPEVPWWVFSQPVLGSSKRLEAIQARLVRVLREFWPGALPEEEREAIGEFGMVENPQYIYVAGPVRLDCLDLGAVGADVGLPAGLVERFQVLSVDADWVLTVENLTSFYQVVGALPPRTVVLYLGGYHNRVRQRFLLRLAETRPGLRFRHRGGMDLGGFRIFVHLARATGLRLEPWLMDVGTYVSAAVLA